MIRIENAGLGVRVATDIMAANPKINLQTVPGSELNKLTRATGTGADMELRDDGDILEHYIRDLSARKSLTGEYTHDLVQAEVLDNAVAIIQANEDLARNKVNPICKSVLETVNNLFSTELVSAGNSFTIVTDDLPEPCYSPAFDEMIAPDSEAAYMHNDAKFPMHKDPIIGKDEVLQLVETGNAKFDAMIKKYYAESDVMVDTYWSILNSDVREFITTSNSESGRLVAVWLIAKALYNNPPEGTIAYAETYNQYISSLAIKTAQALTTIIKSREFMAKTKMLLRDVSGNVIRVNGEVYSSWLTEGGSPEAMMGYVLQNDNSTSSTCYDTILDNIKLYEMAYRNNEQSRREALAENKLSVVRRLFPVAIRQWIQSDETYAPHLDKLLPLFSERVYKLHTADEGYLWKFIRNSVCEILFENTHVEMILKNIDDICEKYNDIPMDDAVALTRAKFVTDWLSDQITVYK